eukprot:485212_1
MTIILLILFYIIHIDAWTLKNYNPKANPDAIVKTKQARFTILSTNIIRMEYDPSGTFEDRASRIFVNRFTQPPHFTVTNGSTLTISTNDLTLTYQGGPFTASSLTITGKTDTIQFQYKPSGNVNIDNGWSRNLFGTILGLDDMNGDISLNCTINYHHSVDQYAHPHCQWAFFGMDGYAIINDTDTTMMDNNWFSGTQNNNQQDIYFFGHGLNFQQAIYDYTLIAGSIPMLPKYGLGSLHTRWYHYSDYSFRNMINDYESRSIPLDLAVIDMDWHYLDTVHQPWGDYTWSNLLFPNPNITQLWLHNTMGLRTSGNVHDDNGIQTLEIYYQDAANALNVTNGKNIAANISDYNYMMALQDYILEPISNRPTCDGCGFDVFWIDWQQGMKGNYLNNKITPTYILSYVRGTNNIRLNRNIRNMVLGRCGGMGNHRYPVGFSGDQVHDWDSLKYLSYFTPTAANVLFGWSHDIVGGHKSQGYDLNTRWLQFGAYSPIFRIHDKGQGTGECELARECAEPDIWTHPYKYFDIERKVIQERAELLPYIYNATYTAYKTGLILVRSMYIDYPLETNAYPTVNNVIRQQYMFGDRMIISPITQRGGLFDVVTQKIFLPSIDEFYEKHSGNVIQKQSSMSISRGFSLSEMPIYIKTDSVLPISPLHNGHVIGKANEPSFDRLRFDIYPSLSNGDKNGETFIYEDDGITFDYLNENETNSVKTYIDWTYNSKSYEFNANIVSKGNYNGFVANRYYGIRIYNVLSPKSVMCNNIPIKYNAFYFNRFSEENMYYFDGKTMSLTVNCPLMSANVTTTVNIIFARDWMEDFKYTSLYGMKGKINRAIQCKGALDETNYPYGTSSRSNMTFIATYSMLLGNIGNDYDAQYDYVQQFDDFWQNGLKEVKNLNVAVSGEERYKFCNDLYNTI